MHSMVQKKMHIHQCHMVLHLDYTNSCTEEFLYLTHKQTYKYIDLTYVLFICSAISSSEKCLRVSKTESYGLSRICFEMTRQATMPSSSEKCLRVSKTESYTLSRICFEMTPQCHNAFVEGVTLSCR
jgi:hypothetical protein